jgi:hypothetical protein
MQEFSKPMSNPDSGLALTNLGVRLYCFGGKNQETFINRSFDYQVMFTISIPIIISE